MTNDRPYKKPSIGVPWLTVVLPVDGAAYGEFVQHGHDARSASRAPVVGEAQVVVRSEVEHALRTVRQPDCFFCDVII